MGKKIKAHKVLMGKHEGKNRFESLGVNGNIKMDLKEIGREGVDCIHLAYDKWSALGSTATHVHVS
jgi:hypothetical protein